MVSWKLTFFVPVEDLDFVDLTTDNILEVYDLPRCLDDWNVQQLLKPLVDFGASVQVSIPPHQPRSPMVPVNRFPLPSIRLLFEHLAAKPTARRVLLRSAWTRNAGWRCVVRS